MISCSKQTGNCYESTGEIITETRQVPYFNSLKMLDNVDVELISGNENLIEVTAGKNIINNIIVEVVDSEVHQDTVLMSSKQLKISNINECNWLRSYDKPIKVKICCRNIMNIEYRSNGDLDCIDPIEKDTFAINVYEGSGIINLHLISKLSYLNFHYGTADLNVKGSSMVNYLYQASFGKVDAREFITNFNYLENRSSNDCYVNAKVYLGATINSIGNVYYTGNPLGKSLIKNGSGNFFPIVE